MARNEQNGEFRAPASLERVKAYMVATYQLPSLQVDALIEGAGINLAATFASAEKALAGQDLPLFVQHVHTAKGALLNMGLDEWAMFAKEIESGGRNNEPLDFRRLLQELRNGLLPLLSGPDRGES